MLWINWNIPCFLFKIRLFCLSCISRRFRIFWRIINIHRHNFVSWHWHLRIILNDRLRLKINHLFILRLFNDLLLRFQLDLLRRLDNILITGVLFNDFLLRILEVPDWWRTLCFLTYPFEVVYLILKLLNLFIFWRNLVCQKLNLIASLLQLILILLVHVDLNVLVILWFDILLWKK
jgi:hypothetical protein